MLSFTNFKTSRTLFNEYFGKTFIWQNKKKLKNLLCFSSFKVIKKNEELKIIL